MGKVPVNTSRMELINDIMEVENREEIYKVRVIEEQMILTTFLKADSTCQGCHVQESKIDLQSMKADEEDDDKINEVEKSLVNKDVEDDMSRVEDVVESLGNPRKEVAKDKLQVAVDDISKLGEVADSISSTM